MEMQELLTTALIALIVYWVITGYRVIQREKKAYRTLYDKIIASDEHKAKGRFER